MTELLNDIVFKRLILLRKEFGFTQKEFVIEFNIFIKKNNITLSNKSNNPLKADNYSNIERRLTSQNETFIHIMKYYQVIHDINPAWVFIEDNSTVSKFLTIDPDVEEIHRLKKKLEIISKVIKD